MKNPEEPLTRSPYGLPEPHAAPAGPTSLLVLFNLSKRNNLGQLFRTANALGVGEVLVVGKKDYHDFGSFGTTRTTPRRHFYSLTDACEYARQRGCTICGIEIHPEAEAVQTSPFRGPTAFLVGNEGTGLSEQQQACCDHFVYIPQYGSGASLNVNVAAAIVLHHYALWAGRVENVRQGQKFHPPGAP